MLIFVVLYISDLGEFPLSIDEELFANTDFILPIIGHGRWTVSLVGLLFLPQPVVPFLPLALFGLGGAIGYIFLVRAHGSEELTLKHYALFPIFIAFPTWFFVIEFYAVIPSYGLSLMLSGIAIYHFSWLSTALEQSRFRLIDDKWRILGIIIAVAISVGSYQSFLIFFAVAGAGVLLASVSAKTYVPTTPWRSLLLLAALIFSSFLLYLLISKGLLLVLDLPLRNVVRYVNPDIFLNDPVSVVASLLREAWIVYSGSRSVYGQNAFVFGLLILGGVCSVIVGLKRANLASVVVGIVLIGLILLAPFSLHLLAGGFMPYRSMVALPYVVWFFATCLMSPRFVYPVRAVAAGLVALAIFESLYTLSLFEAANHMTRIHDRLLAQQIYTRITAIDPEFDRVRDYPVDFYGAYPFQTIYPQIRGSTIGRSFFEWSGGNRYRIVYYMRMLGYANLRATDSGRLPEDIDHIREMPVWPQEGSVELIDGVMLIKLGNGPN